MQQIKFFKVLPFLSSRLMVKNIIFSPPTSANRIPNYVTVIENIYITLISSFQFSLGDFALRKPSDLHVSWWNLTTTFLALGGSGGFPRHLDSQTLPYV